MDAITAVNSLWFYLGEYKHCSFRAVEMLESVENELEFQENVIS